MRGVVLVALIAVALASAQNRPLPCPESDSPTGPESKQSLDKQIAARFAPVLYQGLGDNPRSDYMTNFDFDGDWKGDNNWRSLDDHSLPLRAYVYYSVTETATHYFVVYAFFHPRDYKGGMSQNTIIDALLAKRRAAGKDPSGGLETDIAMSHENDLEGCLVVAQKRGGLGDAAVQYVELMAHNHFLKHCPGEGQRGLCEAIQTDGERPLIFLDPRGHGPSVYTADQQQVRRSVSGMILYRYTGHADVHVEAKEAAHPEHRRENMGYDLIPIYGTLWTLAQHGENKGENETFGESADYGTRSILKYRAGAAPERIERTFGVLGSAFRGEVGAKNKARPPWGWFDERERDRPRGEWFLDPASVVARHFSSGSGFSPAYIYNPYFGLCR